MIIIIIIIAIGMTVPIALHAVLAHNSDRGVLTKPPQYPVLSFGQDPGVTEKYSNLYLH